MALSSSLTTLRVEKPTTKPRLTSMMSRQDSTLPPPRREKQERIVKDSMRTCKLFKMHSTMPSGRERNKPLSSKTMLTLRLKTMTQLRDHQSSQRKKIQVLLGKDLLIQVKAKLPEIKVKVQVPKVPLLEDLDLIEQYESVHKAEHRSKSISEG